MKGVIQGLFLILVMVIIGLVTYNIGTTSATMSELLGKSMLWGTVIALSAAFIWERL